MEYKFLALTFKAKHDIDPASLYNELGEPYMLPRHLHSGDEHLLVKPLVT